MGGIVRGFFSVLDCCSAIAEWASGTDRETVQCHSDSAFTQLKTLSAATRTEVLRDEEKLYCLAPTSRYRRFGLGTSPKQRFPMSPTFTSPKHRDSTLRFGSPSSTLSTLSPITPHSFSSPQIA